MRVTVSIPIVSAERLSLLYHEIESLQTQTYENIKIVIVVDGDGRLFSLIRIANENLKLKNTCVVYNERRRDWVYAQNSILKLFDSDFYVCASDDHFFPPDCIKTAVESSISHFPDGDGVVSLWKRNNAVIGLFGRKWVERFPEREVFCPEYTHYCADWECVEFAKKIKKLINIPGDIKVHHNGITDKTHSLSLKARDRDAERRRIRQERGYLWGENFDLIVKK